MRRVSDAGRRVRGPMSGLRARILFALVGALGLMFVVLTMVFSTLIMRTLDASGDALASELYAELLRQSLEPSVVCAPGRAGIRIRDAEGSLWHCAPEGKSLLRVEAEGEGSSLSVPQPPLELVRDGRAQAQRLVALLVLYLLLACGGVVLVGYLLLTYWIVWPLRRLGLAAERVASDPERSLQASYPPTEVGDLARALERMVGELRAARSGLLERVKELQEANEALDSARGEVARAERLASVGTLAAGVAHEVGNPLSAVSGMMQLIEAEPLSPEARDLLERCRAELRRMEGIVRELLAYAQGGNEEERDAMVDEAVEAARSLASHHPASRRCRVVFESAGEGLQVQMGAGALQQVLVNLLLNAAEASSDGQVVQVRASSRERWVEIEVVDEGEGMDEETLRRAFVPFFTTRAPGSGTGLGLAVCERLVNECGGSVTVESTPGEGTCVRLSLPRYSASSPK